MKSLFLVGLAGLGACATPPAAPRAVLPLLEVHQVAACDSAARRAPSPVHVASLGAEEALRSDLAALRVHAYLVDPRRHAWTREALGDASSEREPVPPQPSELAVIAADGTAVRLRLEGSRLRALAWFPRSSLGLTVIQRTTLALAPCAAADPRAGVTLLPGAEVQEIHEADDARGSVERGALRHVRATLDEARFAGWLAKSDLGDLFAPTDAPSRSAVDARVRAGATVLASPSGSTVASLVVRAGTSSDGWMYVATRPGAPRGFVAVRFPASERASIEGLVAERDVTRIAPDVLERVDGISLDGFGTMSDASQATLRRGTWLYDPGGVERIAFVRANVVAYNVDTPSGATFCGVEVFFPLLGFQRAAVRCADLAP